MEHQLRVGGPGDVAEQVRIDGEQQLSSDPREVGDVAVVHEDPVVEPERVAVGLLHRCSGAGPDVCQEQTGTHLGGQLPQVLVAPGGIGAAEQGRDVPVAVPADSGAVAVGHRHVRSVPPALLDQGTNRGSRAAPRARWGRRDNRAIDTRRPNLLAVLRALSLSKGSSDATQDPHLVSGRRRRASHSGGQRDAEHGEGAAADQGPARPERLTDPADQRVRRSEFRPSAPSRTAPSPVPAAPGRRRAGPTRSRRSG